jgi:biotin carboxyl carrier protein
MICSKSLFFSMILFFVLLMLLGLSPWSPKYPIRAKLVYQPKLIIMRAPLSGMLNYQNIHIGDHLELGEPIFDFTPLKSLVDFAYQQEKLKDLQTQLKFYEQEIPIQEKYFKRLSNLFQKKLISLEDFQQKKLRYFDYIFKKQAIVHKIRVLQHQLHHRLQTPIAGKVLKLFSKNGEIIYKDQKIAIIQPNNQIFKLLITVPVTLKDKVFIGQTVRLALQSEVRFKAYPIVAHITEISPLLKKDQILMSAEIQKTSLLNKNVFSKLSLDGYLIGPKQAFWKYLKNGLMGE